MGNTSYYRSLLTQYLRCVKEDVEYVVPVSWDCSLLLNLAIMSVNTEKIALKNQFITRFIYIFLFS